MSAAKHTPGPWRACRPGSNFQKGKLFIRPANSEKLIATVSAEVRFAETLANGDLIAAAPDLLAALKDVCSAYEAERRRNGRGSDESQSLDEARAAIAKAEGRS